MQATPNSTIRQDQQVTVVTRGGEIVIRPAPQIRAKLLAKIVGDLQQAGYQVVTTNTVTNNQVVRRARPVDPRKPAYAALAAMLFPDAGQSNETDRLAS